MAKKTARRFRLTFSLRVLLVLVTAFAVWMGWLIPRAQKQKQAVDWIQSVGGEVFYKYQTDETGELAYGINPRPPGPKFLRKFLGIDYFATVDAVYLNKQPVDELSPITSLRQLRFLQISNREGQLTDISPLANLTRLKYLYVGHYPISDISSLESLRQLDRFNIFGTKIDDVSTLGTLPLLEEIMLAATKVTDLEPLASLRNLQYLNITGTPVSDDQITTLKTKLPNCNIIR